MMQAEHAKSLGLLLISGSHERAHYAFVLAARPQSAGTSFSLPPMQVAGRYAPIGLAWTRWAAMR